jgi:lipopolysaccharide/colanic/teichoic acid biosynthesis glycosyltransferase
MQRFTIIGPYILGMTKRIFDFFCSLSGLIILTPVFLIIAVLVAMDSKGSIFFLQERIGKDQLKFKIFKFRTMYIDSDKKGLLTIGMADSRVTRTGLYLRKFKLDELPQLINVLLGEMSLVGPRPEVSKYVSQYTALEQTIFNIKPGITDYASLEFLNENEILGNVNNPEEVYVKEIMPAKLALNLKYMNEQSFSTDLKIIVKTILRIAGIKIPR